MNIAFYAPMKPPSSTVPSGDLRVARALIAALESRGHAVRVASEFVSYLTRPDDFAIQDNYVRARELATTLAASLRSGSGGDRPDLWFTYHVYYKAPDWIGPTVADVLGIPYVIAEASFAPKRADGPWNLNLRGVEAAIRRADVVFNLNSADAVCVQPLLAASDRLVPLKPFLPAGTTIARPNRTDGPVRLLTVAMMRPGAKLESYRILAKALDFLPADGWHLTIAGDGPAESEVRTFFAAKKTVTWVGRLEAGGLAALFAEADLFVWPAIDEAYGMAMLEAQQAGLAVVAGRSGGVADIIAHGRTGILVAPGDARAFGEAIAALMGDTDARVKMGCAAAAKTAREHNFERAAETIDRQLLGLAT